MYWLVLLGFVAGALFGAIVTAWYCARPSSEQRRLDERLDQFYWEAH